MALASKSAGFGWGTALTKFASRVRTSADWKRLAVAVLAGAASVLALAPFFAWPILFVTVPCLIWLIDGCNHGESLRDSVWSAALAGWLFGFGYFSAGLFWVGEAFLVQADLFLLALPFAVTLLPAGLALFFAAAAAVARVFWMPGFARVLVLAVTLTMAEWLRGHVFTGFPWNTLGYGFTASLPMMQVVSWIGVYGLTIFVVTLSAAPAVAAVDATEQDRGGWAAVKGAVLTVVILASFWSYGTWRLTTATPTFVEGVRMRVVQASIPQREKWVPENQERIFASHLTLSQQNAAGVADDLAGITHVIWPEVAMPFLPLEIPAVQQRIGAMLPPGTHLLSGALRRDPPNVKPGGASPTKQSTPRRAYNSLLVFDSDGQVPLIYDKIHLVPFGEYLPFQTILEAIGLRQLSRMRGGFASGAEPRPLLNIGQMSGIAGLICYEAIFPGQVSAGTRPEDRPQLYINVTNDGWFGNTTGPRQHFHQAQVRAVEMGVPLLRSANNGISAMIGPAGRVFQRLDLNHKGSFDASVPKPLRQTIYGRFGDWTLIGLLALFMGLVCGLTTARAKGL
ncbi:MAG: apolipoprotein N-acyltransferase [Alphaproteobacteria bacterium]|nr:apolipoprotein N-acyltransferase [Alphaproteobacteria bacterium]